ncbi:hypothetical protein NCS52_01470000 [Fusarium sp. LHS14.1]|nr:hypothetical protein NCS52_01470000 [Fusarium sp. LHS14.1]
MPRPSPPSDEEVRCYYVGLPGKPRLVARSSTEPWSPQTDFGHTRGKTLDSVGQHPIVAVWNDTAGPLRRKVLETLELENIQWVAIDILRLGYQNVRGILDETPLNPVTVLVSVVPSSTTWNAGVDVVLRCREILRRQEIHDVEVEMKESKISQCNLGARPVQEPPSSGSVNPSRAGLQLAQESQKPTSGPIAQPEEWNALFPEFLGLSIASLHSPFHRGTKGLYLRIRGTARILLLTCRHIAFTEPDVNGDFHHCDAAPRAIIQPSSATLQGAHKSVKEDIKRSERDMEKNRDLASASALRKFNEAMAERTTREALEQRLSALEEPSSRTIGHVLFSPKISEGRSPSGEKRCRDWALIELDQEKHKSVLATLTNGMFCGMTAKMTLGRQPSKSSKGAIQQTTTIWNLTAKPTLLSSREPLLSTSCGNHQRNQRPCRKQPWWRERELRRVVCHPN